MCGEILGGVATGLTLGLASEAISGVFGGDDPMDEYKRLQGMSEDAARRKYAADLENYDTALRSYKKNLNYLDSLIADPSGHPDYRKAKRGLEKQFKGMRRSLKETLRKRGRTGGVQDKVLQDLQTTFEESLTSIHEDVAGKARQQKLQLMEPPKPYLGMPEVQWQKFFQPTQVDPIADLTGFGMMMALKNQSTTPGEEKAVSTLARSGQSMYPDFGLGDIYDWTQSLDYDWL